MSVYLDLKDGLKEAIEYEKGAMKARTVVLQIAPLQAFTSDEIKAIRNDTGLTQKLFAQYMGVSIKTVEAWEAGRNHPDGPACRLLELTQKDPNFAKNSGIVIT